MMATSQPQAGWYPDPSTPNQQLWWDGARWSGQVRSGPPAAAQDAADHHASAGTRHRPTRRIPWVAAAIAVLIATFAAGATIGYMAASSTIPVDLSDGEWPTLRIFLCDGSTCPEAAEPTVADYLVELIDDDAVARLRHRSSAQAYLDFRVMFADQPALVESADPTIFPASIDVWTHSRRQALDLAERFGARAGVEETVMTSDQP